MTESEEIAESCRRLAKFYEDKPGLVGAPAIVDLYRVIALLADTLSRGEQEDKK